MKKRILLILVLITLFLITSVLAIECSSNKDCDDGLKYTKDICENKGTEESYCINEVTKPELSLLSQILDALKELLLKDWTINVEPTPVIVEPNINIEPNITIPEKECKWEKFNQRQDIDYEVSWGGGGQHYFTKVFYIPENIMYEDVKVLSGRILVKCNEHYCPLLINGIGCGVPLANTFDELVIPEACFNSLVGGANNLTIRISNGGSGTIKSINLELEVKPANC